MSTMASFTETQLLAIQIAPRITGLLSIIGSVLVVYNVAKIKWRHQMMFHRILLFMSLVDILNSVAFFLANWPMLPPDGIGNQASCDAQGWMLQFGLSIPIWNALLAVNYLLRIRYEVPEETIKDKQVYFHLCAWLWPFVTACIALGLQLYNDALLWCWIAPFPSGCGSAGLLGQPCERGEDFAAFQFGFFFVPLWICWAIVIWAMVMIFKHVANHEKELSRNGLQSIQKQSGQVKLQAFFYSGAFILTWLFGSINRLVQAAGYSVFPLVLLHSIFVPAQGFFNYLVFKFPEFRIWATKHNYCCFKQQVIEYNPNKPRENVRELTKEKQKKQKNSKEPVQQKEILSETAEMKTNEITLSEQTPNSSNSTATDNNTLQKA